MKKFSFKTLVSSVQLVAMRFPFVLFFLFGLAFSFFLQINKSGIIIKPYHWAFFSLGITLSLTLTLFLEELKNKYLRVGLNLLSIIVLLIYVYSLPDTLLPVHYYQLIILGLVFLLSAFVGSFLKKENDIPFWEFSKTNILQLLISSIFSVVLYAGLSLAILSLKELFKIDVQREVYENLGVICYILFAPIYFLMNIPDKIEKRKQKYSFPTFLKILGLYILLPILILYSLILYVYLFQIIIKWELPNGWVSTLVSILGLGGFLCMLILFPLRLDDENQNKVVNLLSKYFPVLLMPLLVLMSIGIFRRLGDYGLTINRCYVLILNLWLYGISIYLFLTKGHHLKWIIISFAAITLVSSIGPWSVFNVTKRTLVKEVGQLLTEAKLSKNGYAIDNTTKIIKVDSIISEKLGEDINYSCQNFGSTSIQKFFKDSIQGLEAWEIRKRLGIVRKNMFEPMSHKHPDKDIRYFNAYQQFNNQNVDIDGNFKSYIRLQRQNEIENVFESKHLTVKFVNNSFVVLNPIDKTFNVTIPLKLKVKEILKQKKKENVFTANQMKIDGLNFKLMINNITGFYIQKSDSITITEIEANLFLK